jgi:SAM-dependent methyltransferase
MDKKPQIAATYDEMFKEGGFGVGVFDLPYRRSPYFPLFRACAGLIPRGGATKLLEVGCGTGTFAHYLFDARGAIRYSGFDFSPVAVEKARKRTGLADRFFVGDATQAQTYQGLDYNTIVCTEVLEHLENDHGVIEHWARGTHCICSVPNYDADTHVRHFRNEDEVRQRYSKLLDIRGMRRLNKPFLNDLNARAWLQALRWNRYRVDRLLWLFGISDFDRNGGWFVFHGSRKA